ncbi:hypothetical protein BV22DRAFT_852828 [Leucogyrophana mollusca]|uniref:Uncharacterized protein n=1 Tax=Leucogyrophana mollusca TaxID=85980 RepID=A0ACB8B1E7_9AGAM|nr:hypothetical protein BV22DRAFT_852828 [Leucogyrophana mollusca]
MKRLLKHLKPSKKSVELTSSPLPLVQDEENEEDEDRQWWETDNEVEYYKDEAKRTKAYAKCREHFQAQLQSGKSSQFDDLLHDVGATAGKHPKDLALQNLALCSSIEALHLGHFERSLCCLHALDKSEHLPATHLRLSYTYNVQGYRNKAAEHIRLAQGLLLDDTHIGTLDRTSQSRHSRFHDFLSFYLACTVLEDFRSVHLDGPQSAPFLASLIWEKWLKNRLPSEYDVVSVFLLGMYYDVIGKDSGEPSRLALFDEIVATLVRQSRHADAFRVFMLRVEHSSPSWDNHLSFLKHLKKLPSANSMLARVSPAFTAEIELSKARHLHLINKDRKQRDKLLASATNNYRKCGHAWGHIDVQALQSFLIDDRHRDVDSILETAITGTANAVDAFGQADFPGRQMSLLDSLLKPLSFVDDNTMVYEVHKTLRDLYRVTGRTAKFWVVHLLVMSIEVGVSADIGSFLEDCEEFPPQILAVADSNITLLRLKVMFLVAYRTGNTRKIVEHGKGYMDALEASDLQVVASETAEILAAAMLVFDPDAVSPELQREAFSSAQTLLTRWGAVDDALDRTDSAARKMLLLARGCIEFRSVLPPTALAEAKGYLVEVSKLAFDVEEGTTFFIRSSNVEAFYLEALEGYESAIACTVAALRIYGGHDDIETSALAELKMHNARRRVLLSADLTDDSKKSVMLKEAIEELTESLEWYEMTTQVGEILECRYWKALAQHRLGQAEDAALTLSQAVRILEFLIDDAPTSSSATVGSLQYRHSLSTGKNVRRIFNLGLEIATSCEEAPGAWEWIQHSKARSLSDMLKFHGTQVERYPEIYLDDLDWLYRDSPFVDIRLDSLAPLFRMTQLSKSLRSALPEDRAGIKADLRELKKGMREDPVLHGSLAVLTGAPATIDDLQWMSLTSTERVIFFDWTAVGDLLFLVHVEVVNAQIWPEPTPGQRPREVNTRIRMHKLGITVSEVERWRNSGVEGHRYLDRKELSGPDAYDNLNMLRELIAPIKDISREGDMLVLCPTKPLHGIPLHAIEIDVDDDGESVVLLERNPVIYTYSLSVLRQCLARSKSHMKPSAERKAAFFGVYEGIRVNDPEPTHISTHLKALSARFSSSVSFGDQVTHEEFKLRSAEATALVHFHGHTLDQVVALEQSLVLAHEQRFSAQEIFDLELRCAPIVTLIACSSTDQATMPGDEPLGILSAFLYSGAGSAIGTLWKTRSEDGRAWAHEFYSSFESCRAEKLYGIGEDVPVVNLARCLQKAAMAIKAKDDTNAPYHWAQFVLYGSWFGMA